MQVRLNNRVRATSLHESRRGTLIPAVMLSLLVVMAGIALVLDRLWLDSAQIELEAATELSAFAAAAELVSDEILCGGDPVRRINRARFTAGRVAATNHVVGTPLQLDVRSNRDIKFGRFVREPRTGNKKFVETDNGPTTVIVRGERSRRRDNPVALLIRGMDGTSDANVYATSEVSIDNRIVAFRPFENVPVPMLPIAIRDDIFQLAVTIGDEDARTAAQDGITDRLRFNASRQEVVREPDGLLEMTVQSRLSGSDGQETSVVLLDLGGDFGSDNYEQQIRWGIRSDDLEELDGELRVDDRAPELRCSQTISGGVAEALSEIIGQPRMFLTYEDISVRGRLGHGTLKGACMVAGRIMAVHRRAGGCLQLKIQPCVVTTRTAVLFQEEASDEWEMRNAEEDVVPNRYVYKLQLTR